MRVPRTLTVIAAIAAALLFAACGKPVAKTAAPSATVPSAAATSSTESSYGPTGASGGIRIQTTETPVTIEQARTKAGVRFLIPDPALAGQPESAVVVKADNPNSSKPDHIVEVSYKQHHVVLSIETNPPIGVKQLKAQLADPNPEDSVPYSDGRKAQWRAGSVRGNTALIVDAGTQVPPGEEKVAVPATIRWFEGGMQYVLRSHEASVAELQRLADSMK